MNPEKKKLIDKISLNTLIDANKTDLSLKEKVNVIEILNKTYSYAQISVLTGIPKSTISTWVMRGNAKPLPTCKRKNIIELIEYFDNYQPTLDEWGSIEKLRNILNNILEGDKK